MAGAKMENLRLAHMNVPHILYRVDYPGTWTRYHMCTGISAADTDTILDNYTVDEYRKSLADHFDWKSKVPSPYISLFSDRTHADKWALDYVKRSNVERNAVVSVVEIDTSTLQKSCFFHARRLVEEFDLKDVDEMVHCSEYLCLYIIPAWAIIGQRDTKRGFDHEHPFETEDFGNRVCREPPLMRWIPELHGYYEDSSLTQPKHAMRTMQDRRKKLRMIGMRLDHVVQEGFGYLKKVISRRGSVVCCPLVYDNACAQHSVNCTL